MRCQSKKKRKDVRSYFVKKARLHYIDILIETFIDKLFYFFIIDLYFLCGLGHCCIEGRYPCQWALLLLNVCLQLFASSSCLYIVLNSSLELNFLLLLPLLLLKFIFSSPFCRNLSILRLLPLKDVSHDLCSETLALCELLLEGLLSLFQA